ncbi:histidine kinase N-terminal 7TM domain-containing diguanylate cyclase [Breznakiella homolactica]|uniref:diguanylate cyclase n=1 Tax=Breznakiella homolactica TaxID=2798577 RepID=A0A7T7XM78_9SPIR|nr:diguanylate cyclase [Breznakiella homolactica]QQO08818.1 diguanylate cyclase [Breznakiella homolactica]
MIDAVPLAVYTVLALCSLVLIFLTLHKKDRSRMDRDLIFVTAVILCWLVSAIAFFSTRDAALARFLFDLKLPFVALTVLAWFLYIVRFYGLTSYFPRAVTASLFIIPIFTLGIALTSPYHSFIRQEMEILGTYPRHMVRMVRGPWFWYHSVYCYILMLAAFILALTQHKQILRIYRLPSTLLLLGISLSVAANILVVRISLALDLSLVSASFSSMLLYLATKNYHGLDFCIRARQEAFHYLDRSIFILDDEEGIVSANRSARSWLEQTGITPEGGSFRSVAEKMAALSEKQESLDDLGQGNDFYFRSGRIFNLRKKPIYDRRNNPLGSFVFITDETENRKLIAYLDRHSGMDALTGLSNRRQMEEVFSQLDRDGGYPLAIIAGDLNNLKEINDTLGHQQGDILLRVTAETLRSTCPPRARIFRTGGDEFTILLPGHGTEDADLLTDAIRNALEKQRHRYPFKPSIALGVAVQENPGEEFSGTLRRADAAMYRDKERCKSQQAKRTL